MPGWWWLRVVKGAQWQVTSARMAMRSMAGLAGQASAAESLAANAQAHKGGCWAPMAAATGVSPGQRQLQQPATRRPPGAFRCRRAGALCHAVLYRAVLRRPAHLPGRSRKQALVSARCWSGRLPNTALNTAASKGPCTWAARQVRGHAAADQKAQATPGQAGGRTAPRGHAIRHAMRSVRPGRRRAGWRHRLASCPRRAGQPQA